jgi:hypothetical protein
MTSPAPTAEPLLPEGRVPARPSGTPLPRRIAAAMPTWPLIATRHLELRKRRGLMIVVGVVTIAPTFLILGLRLAFHLFDPAHYGPAGYPGQFATAASLQAGLGLIVAIVVGATAGTSDLNDGMFRHLVITGRSRLALYLARIPAGLAILLPVVALAFTTLCLVTSYESVPQPAAVVMNDNVSIPPYLDQAQLQTWAKQHPRQAAVAFQSPAGVTGPRSAGGGSHYSEYITNEVTQFEPPVNEMAKVGLWVELEVGIGFLVGLGLGSLTGQRAVSSILLLGFELIVTPILASVSIPYFLDGQRLDFGVAMDQLRPVWLVASSDVGGLGNVAFGGQGASRIPPMPTWAMISVIVGWIVVWSAAGAWRMMTRDA